MSHVNHRIWGLRANGLVCHWHVVVYGIRGFRANGLVLSLAHCRSTLMHGVVCVVRSLEGRVNFLTALRDEGDWQTG